MGEIPAADYATRLAALRREIAAARLDAFIVGDPDNTYYLTGALYRPFERPFLLIVDAHELADILVPLMKERTISKVSSTFSVKTCRELPMAAGEGWPVELGILNEGRSRIGGDPGLPVGTTSLVRAGAVTVTFVGRDVATHQEPAGDRTGAPLCQIFSARH